MSQFLLSTPDKWLPVDEVWDYAIRGFEILVTSTAIRRVVHLLIKTFVMTNFLVSCSRASLSCRGVFANAL